MRVAVTGATGLIGTKLTHALKRRGDRVTVLSRDPERARMSLGDVEAHAWRTPHEPAPVSALAGRDAVVHLAGENIAQRWSDAVRHRIHMSRELGTRNLVAGLRATRERPRVLVSASGVDYYGDRGAEEITEESAPGEGFLAELCVTWEREAQAAEELGLRVTRMRTAMALVKSGGALAKMLPFFKLGLGGPVAGGDQYVPWIHVDDLVGLYLAAIDGDAWGGPINACAPTPVTNRDFSHALGRALHRPAIAPVPEAAVRALYGDMAQVVTAGRRAVPARALALGYTFAYPDLDGALRDALG
jgi:uncharacterized protein (TIGR01777 family)